MIKDCQSGLKAPTVLGADDFGLGGGHGGKGGQGKGSGHKYFHGYHSFRRWGVADLLVALSHGGTCYCLPNICFSRSRHAGSDEVDGDRKLGSGSDLPRLPRWCPLWRTPKSDHFAHPGRSPSHTGRPASRCHDGRNAGWARAFGGLSCRRRRQSRRCRPQYRAQAARRGGRPQHLRAREGDEESPIA